MIVPYPLFMALHVGTAYMLAKPFPKKYFPALMVFGVVQSIIEHMADVFPTVRHDEPSSTRGKSASILSPAAARRRRRPLERGPSQ